MTISNSNKKASLFRGEDFFYYAGKCRVFLRGEDGNLIDLGVLRSGLGAHDGSFLTGCAGGTKYEGFWEFNAWCHGEIVKQAFKKYGLKYGWWVREPSTEFCVNIFDMLNLMLIKNS